ncbi:MAG: D-2-hydroxyacid dehydrogenase [Opitutaceae bacterium]|nr:D-2-hydroxyacid dehydrogenase [Opitutaceae bacterium]
MALTIWTNTKFDPAVTQLLHDGTRAHRLVTSAAASTSVLVAGQTDPALASADIAFGQPDPVDCLRYPNIKWVEVSTAGYTRYDTPEFLETFRTRGSAFTNASAVFADPCAQHVLAMMLSLGRQLLPSHRDQLTDQSWHYEERRYHSRLLTGQSVLMLGYGAIGRRLTELLAPFGMTLYALRRQTRSETGVRIVPETELTRVLPLVDHIVNILPANPATAGYVNARRLACCRPTAKFYNVGRGTTVDQPALAEALRSKKISAAYLDVMDPEPLPPAHELWTTPNCYITPHTAGGRHDQDETIVRHFLQNLAAYESGGAMTDRVV